MKKCLAMALCAILFFQLLPGLAVIAVERPAQVTASSATAANGETVSIKISVSNCVDAKSIRIVPLYDASILELISGTWLVKGILADNWSEAFGDAVTAFAQNTDINADIFELTFRVRESATAGAAANVGCQIVIKTMQGKEEIAVQTSVSGGTITVNSLQSGVTVSGMVTSYITSGDVTVKLSPSGTTVAAYTAIVTGGNGVATSFSIGNVETGVYTMEVSKANHATRTYTITVGSSNVTQNVKICPVGDVTGEGVVNIKDFQRLLRHVNKTTPLSDYELSCGDVTGEGACNIKDFQRLLRHVNKTNPLF